MQFYIPSPLSLGYIPRGSYRPALVPTYLEDEYTSALPFDGLSYPSFSHSSPRLGVEARYSRALHELQAAEEEFEAHLTLKRARQAAILREQAAHRERALAIQAEVERIERARALQAHLTVEHERRQRALQAQVGLERAHRQKRALLHTAVDANPRDIFASECPFAKRRVTHSGPSCRAVRLDSEDPTLASLLKLFTGIHPQSPNPPQQSSSPAPSQQRSEEAQPSEREKPAADALNDILEFIHGLTAHARDASGKSETISKVRPHVKSIFLCLICVSQPSPDSQTQAAPVDDKGKGKAKAEPVVAPTLLQALFGAHTQGPLEQELRDMELAIKLSLEDRNAAEAKKGSGAKVPQSSAGASSSSVSSHSILNQLKTADVFMQVKLDGAVPSSRTSATPSDATPVTSKHVPDPVPRPTSPLTTIRAVRNRLSTVQSAFKFPSVLDFDQSEPAVSPNSAPIRAYENTLNGLLEQLDAIESDGDEEVRNVRREVVREVEKALEDLDRKVSEKVPKPQVSKGVEMKGYDAEVEEVQALPAQDAAPADATLVAKGAEPSGPEPPSVISPTEADVGLAISEEYLRSSPAVLSPKQAVGEFGDDGVAPTASGDVSALDADESSPVSGLEDPSDSVATITATSTFRSTSKVDVSASPDPEAFLTSMSHDQFTFPLRPTSSDSGASPADVQEDTVLVDNSEEGESVKSGEDGWSEVDA